MTFDHMDKLVESFCFLLECWGYSSCALVGLMALAWVTQQVKGEDRR
jgi:hypothetical protein